MARKFRSVDELAFATKMAEALEVGTFTMLAEELPKRMGRFRLSVELDDACVTYVDGNWDDEGLALWLAAPNNAWIPMVSGADEYLTRHGWAIYPGSDDYQLVVMDDPIDWNRVAVIITSALAETYDVFCADYDGIDTTLYRGSFPFDE